MLKHPGGNQSDCNDCLSKMSDRDLIGAAASAGDSCDPVSEDGFLKELYRREDERG